MFPNTLRSRNKTAYIFIVCNEQMFFLLNQITLDFSLCLSSNITICKTRQHSFQIKVRDKLSILNDYNGVPWSLLSGNTHGPEDFHEHQLSEWPLIPQKSFTIKKQTAEDCCPVSSHQSVISPGYTADHCHGSFRPVVRCRKLKHMNFQHKYHVCRHIQIPDIYSALMYM